MTIILPATTRASHGAVPPMGADADVPSASPSRARRSRAEAPTARTPPGVISAAMLSAMAQAGVVQELVLVEQSTAKPRTWCCQVLLAHESTPRELAAARGGARMFRSLDTLWQHLTALGVVDHRLIRIQSYQPEYQP